MGEFNMEEMSLPAIFEQARKLHSMASDFTVDQETLRRKGIEALRLCDDRVSKLGLFSSNESKDDVSTANLKYLLVPFYLGELLEKAVQDERLQVLKKSMDQFKEFISICEALELVPEEEMPNSALVAAGTLAVQRGKKIARIKRHLAAKAKLREIRERKERRDRSLRAAALSAPVDSGEEDMQDDDGEDEREAWLTTISLAVFKALDLLDVLKKQEQILLAVKERESQEGGGEYSHEILDERTKRAESWHQEAASRAPFLRRLQPITCATFAQDVIEGRAKASEVHEHKHQPMIFGPASLVGGRLTSEGERMAAQVFQPGDSSSWAGNLIPLSLDFELREMEMLNKWQERNMKLMEAANSSWHKDGPRTASDDEEAAEKAKGMG